MYYFVCIYFMKFTIFLICLYLSFLSCLYLILLFEPTGYVNLYCPFKRLGLGLLASPFIFQSSVADLPLTLAFSPLFSRNCFVAFAARRDVLIFLCEIQPHFFGIFSVKRLMASSVCACSVMLPALHRHKTVAMKTPMSVSDTGQSLHWELGQDTHTHTHAGKPEIAVNLVSAFSHPGLSLDCEVNCPSLVRDGHVFCCFACFFCWGSYWRKPLCEIGENMQTPHRKARETGHWRPGENLPPRTNSAPCGNRTQDLLAVRRQCKHLSHRATQLCFH